MLRHNPIVVGLSQLCFVYIFAVFNVGCTTVQSTVLLSHVVCLSVRLWRWWIRTTDWKSWKLIARTISPTSSLFIAQRSSTYSQENMEKFWGEQVGWEKVACWSTKMAISLKRIKIDEKLLWRAYRKSPTLFRFFGSSPYFYFRFRLYGHWDGRFCLIFARTAQQSVGDVRGNDEALPKLLWVFSCYIDKAHCAVIFTIGQLSCIKNR